MQNVERKPAPMWVGAFDGAALPNPGRMGIGAVLQGPQGEHYEISRQAGHHGCNNEAEVLALCAVMELALAQSVRHLEIAGDSDFATRLVHDADSQEALRLRPILEHARDLMTRFETIQIKWVPRYRNHDAESAISWRFGTAAEAGGEARAWEEEAAALIERYRKRVSEGVALSQLWGEGRLPRQGEG